MIHDQNIPAFYKVRIVFPASPASNFRASPQVHLGRNRIKPETQIRKTKSKKLYPPGNLERNRNP
jgi:hypothetical protein